MSASLAWYILGFAVGAIVLLIYAMARAAGRYDRDMEQDALVEPDIDEGALEGDLSAAVRDINFRHRAG